MEQMLDVSYVDLLSAFQGQTKHNERWVFDLPLFPLHLWYNLRCHHIMGKLSNEKDKYIVEVTLR